MVAKGQDLIYAHKFDSSVHTSLEWGWGWGNNGEIIWRQLRVEVQLFIKESFLENIRLTNEVT